MPTTGQIGLLIVSATLFSIGAGLSLTRLWHERSKMRIAAKVCCYFGLVMALGVLIWHSSNRGQWVPLGDNFDTLIWLGLILASFVLYIQRRRPIGGLDWFLLPMVTLLLIGAAAFGRAKPHEYVDSSWFWLHRISYGCVVAFLVAGAAGVMYLIANHKLRNKSLSPGPNLASLERLEHLTLRSVTLGFALLTIALITGAVRMAHENQSKLTIGSPKIWLAFAAWVVYAIVLHSPINPSFKGRKVAILSIVGLALMLGTLVAVQFMPGGGDR